jgi:hypothetical protein
MVSSFTSFRSSFECNTLIEFSVGNLSKIAPYIK